MDYLDHRNLLISVDRCGAATNGVGARDAWWWARARAPPAISDNTPAPLIVEASFGRPIPRRRGHVAIAPFPFHSHVGAQKSPHGAGSGHNPVTIRRDILRDVGNAADQTGQLGAGLTKLSARFCTRKSVSPREIDQLVLHRVTLQRYRRPFAKAE
jgi:hypothetical protein